MPEHYFYYGPAYYVACEEHMARALGSGFPATAKKVEPTLHDPEMWDLEKLVSALTASGELPPNHFKRLGERTGSVEDHCMSMH
ncbi:hypothetical protein [Streptomyces sp. NPDC051662]|uniref:hypothetical protein n=1 Tax=Streptomyces sp. NPDC051662 TaxID=3154750 RepID=UPI00342560CB